jgi:hypothetical protein
MAVGMSAVQYQHRRTLPYASILNQSQFRSYKMTHLFHFFPSHCPDSLMPIGLDHPESKTQFNEANSPSKQAVPDRIGIGKNAQELQPFNWDLND